MGVRVCRIYDGPEPLDGLRVLVDGLWPRGMKKADAPVDLWLKAIAPTRELRQWYGHDPERWEPFVGRFTAELDANPEPVERLLTLAREGEVQLLYSSRERVRNSAMVIADYLRARLSTV